MPTDPSRPAAPDPDPARRPPWRSAALGWAALALVLLAGVPVFLCMPPWNDVTLHDMAARSILRGGVHYRDVFDTNLPGIDWAMAAVRAAFGWGYEVLRAADLAVIAAEIWLLLGWVRRAGGTNSSAAWLAAAAALFYLGTSEFCHVQRDPWLLLPALVAARLRLRRATAPPEPATSRSPLALAVLEGLAWGAAVWVKPHVVVPALAVWAVSAVLIARRESGRAVRRDLAGLVLGGVLAGSAGVAWLTGTGAWPYFLDVFLHWNPGYVDGIFAAAGDRLVYFFTAFRPWSWVHYAAIPLAVLALREARAFSRSPGGPRAVPVGPRLYAAADTEAVAAGRALLAALYLGWFAQGVLLQKGFDYVQVPVMFLGLAVVACHRWATGFAFLGWFAVLGVLANVPGTAPAVRSLGFWQSPFTDPGVMRYWPRCWREGGSPELRDRFGQYIRVHCGTNWENLTDVANYLRTVDPPLGPRELNCWHDSTHPLYLMLNLEPATRYMHYGTAFGIPSKDNGIQKQIAREVLASPQRYVVSDLARMTHDPDLADAPGAGGDPGRLPRWFPKSQRDRFPWNQPIVFRSGRYLVHEVVNPPGPVETIDVPDWFRLDELGPGE